MPEPTKNPFHPYANSREKLLAEEAIFLNEKINIQLIKDNDNYKDDVTVCINGKVWQLQRGVPLQVPRRVAIQLAQASHQESIAALRQDGAKDIFLGER